MQIQLNNLPKSQAELIIEITPQEYQPHLEAAAKKLSQRIKIDGFRPGNVPYNIMVQKMGEGEIMNEALDEIISHTFVKAIIEKKLDTLDQPKIEITKMAPGNNLVYKATVILLPKVELPDLNLIKIEKDQIKIGDKEIDHALEHLAKSRAAEELVERAAQKTDMVKLDYNISIAGVPQDGGQQKNFEVYLGDSHMVPGFEEEIIGLKKDGIKKFDIKFPADYFQKNFAGKNAAFDVKIKGVYKLNIPSLDDDFARSLGKFKNLAELKKQIKQNIQAEKTAEQDKKLENEMLKKIIEKTKFDDLPDKIIANEVEVIINELATDLTDKGLKIETWLANIKKTMDEFKHDLRPQAEIRVKSALIIRAVAHQENIKVADQELKAEIDKLKKVYQNSPEIEKQLQLPAYKAQLANILNGQKVVEWLKKKMIN